MSRKNIIIAVVVFIVGIATGIGFFLWQTQTKKDAHVLPSGQQETKEHSPSVSTKTYEDPSGFSFNYPDNFDLQAKEVVDDTTYADITLTAKDVSGKASIQVTDTKLKTPAEFFDKGATLVDAKIGTLVGKQLKDADTIRIVAIDQGILFVVESTFENDQSFWNAAVPTITESFVFQKQTQSTNTQSNDSSSDVTFEGEETVE